MSDTPETDAAVEAAILQDRNHPRIDWVPAYFARELERERDEATGTIMKIEEIFIDSQDMHEDWMKVGNIAIEYFKK